MREGGGGGSVKETLADGDTKSKKSISHVLIM